MLKKILVPLDGSALAEPALTYATALASETGAELVLLRAAIAHTMVGADPRERQLGAIHEAEEYLEQLAVRVRAHGCACETVVRFGHAVDCIVESARTRQVDLIVMATHGRTGPGRWVLGSVAESVVAASPVPVLVQRAWQPQFGAAVFSDSPKLIVPLDGSLLAETALQPAATLAEDLGGRLVLLKVEDDAFAIVQATAYLAQAQARLAAIRPALSIETDVRVGEPAQGIDQAVVHHEAVLVVMATHGRSGLRRAVLGSIAGKVVQHGVVPVVLFRPAPVEDDLDGPVAVGTLTSSR